MNKIAKNFIAIFIGTISSRVFSLLMVIYLARVLGPDDFGVINFATAFVTYFAMIGSLGLQGLGIVEIAKNKKELRKYVNEITSLKIVLGVIAFALLTISVFFINKSSVVKITILITGISIILNSFFLDWVFNAIQEMKYNSKAQIISSAISFIIVVIAISTGIYTKVYLAPIATNTAMFCANLYLVYVYLKETDSRFSFIFNISRYVELLKMSWPFFFSGVFATINGNIDTIILGFMKSNYEVGLYNAAYKIINILISMLTFVFTPIFPVLIEYFKDKEINKLSLIINKTRKIILVVAIPLAAGSLLLSGEVMYSLYGSKYEGVKTTFTILLLYVCILYIREIYGYQLTAWGFQKKYMNIVLISSTTNIFFNIILIPRFGIEGAAFTTMISEIINLILMMRAARNIIRIKYDNEYILKVIASTILMAISILALKHINLNAYILIVVAIIVYFMCVFILKAITIDELKGIKNKNMS